jgi:hypothetical protein
MGDDDDIENDRQACKLRSLLQERTGGARDAPLFMPIDARGRPSVGGLARVRTSAMTNTPARRAMMSSSPSLRR